MDVSFHNLSLHETSQDENGNDISSKVDSIPSITFLGDTGEEAITDVLSSINVTHGSSYLVMPIDDNSIGEVRDEDQNHENDDFEQNIKVPNNGSIHEDPDFEEQNVEVPEDTDDEAFPKPRSNKPETWRRNKVKKLSDLGLHHVSLAGKQKQARAMRNGCTDKCK